MRKMAAAAACSGGVWGRFVETGNAMGSPTADFTSTEVEAVGADRVLPPANDAAHGGLSLTVGPPAEAAVVAALLEPGEKPACAANEPFASAEVDGV